MLIITIDLVFLDTIRLMIFNITAIPLTKGEMKNPATGASHIKQAINSTRIEIIVNIIEITFRFVQSNSAINIILPPILPSTSK